MILSFLKWMGWPIFRDHVSFRVYYLIIDRERERVAVWYPQRYIVWYMSIWCPTSKCIMSIIYCWICWHMIILSIYPFQLGAGVFYFTSLRRQRKNHFHQIGGSKNIGDFEQLRKDRTGCEPPLSHPTYPTQEEGFEEALFFCGGSRLTRHYCWQILSRKHPLRPQVQNDSPENDGLQKESPFPKGWF